MFYENKREHKFKIKEVSEMIDYPKSKLYRVIKEMERSGAETFKKTPYGSRIIKESQIDKVKEFALLKDVFRNSKDVASIIQNTSYIGEEEDRENFDWAKGLKYAIWRRH